MITYVSRKLVSMWNQLIGKKGRITSHHSPPLRTKDVQLDNNYVKDLAKKYTGKLLLRDEIVVQEALFQKLLTYRIFTPIPSIQNGLFFTKCIRCNNKKKSLFAEIPCSRCQKRHRYCRNCINMGRVMECEHLYYWSGERYHWPQLKSPCTWNGTLTEAQQHAADKIMETVKRGGEQLVWAVTGAGKTEMLFQGITTALELGKRVCIATPRADVVRELLPRLQRAFTSLHIQALYSGSRDNDGTAQLMIATTHQLLRYQHAFDVLIIDEIDAFPFHHDKSLQFAARRAAKKNAARIYLTATPRKKLRNRVMTKKIDYVFVPVRFHGLPLEIPNLFYCSSLKRRLENNMLPEKFIQWLKEREKPTRQMLIFVPTIQLANSLREPLISLFLHHQLISNQKEMISVHAEDKVREEKITSFREKKIYALITTTILERGVTFPSIDVAVLDAGHIIFDEAALVQITGRAGRSPVDPKGEVVFFHDGKTDAMIMARDSILEMNKRAMKLTTNSKKE